MKVVIAPDSYKETLSSLEVADAIEMGFKSVFPAWDYVKCPMADGGEGSVEALVAASSGKFIDAHVTGPLGQTHKAFYGISSDGKTAFIEMATASGIELVSDAMRNPLLATSYGTGELIQHALDLGVVHLILCIGGSATNDAGCGMMQALGVSFKDVEGKELGFGGKALEDLASIDISGLDNRLSKCQIEVACDVTNPLCGPNGASNIYGPQKGATVEMVNILDSALLHFSNVVEQELGVSINSIPGAGAAGGMGAAFYAFLNAELKSGIDIIINAVGLDELIRTADLVITGEGRLDSQSINGKVPIGVASLAKKRALPVIAIAGALGDDIDAIYIRGIDAAFDSVYKLTTFDDVTQNAKGNLVRSSFNVASSLRVGIDLKLGG